MSIDSRNIMICAVFNNTADTLCFHDTEIIGSTNLTSAEDAIQPSCTGNTGNAPVPEYWLTEDGQISIYNYNDENQLVYVWLQRTDSEYHICYDTVMPRDSSSASRTQLDQCDGQESSLYGYWTLTVNGSGSNGYQLEAKLLDLSDLNDQANTAVNTTYAQMIEDVGSAFNDYASKYDLKDLMKSVSSARKNPGTSVSNPVTDMLNSSSFAGVNLSQSNTQDSSRLLKAVSICGEVDVAVGVGLELAGGVILDIEHGNSPHGYISVNGTFGIQKGVSVGIQAGFWFHSLDELSGFSAGGSLGVTVPTSPPPPPAAFVVENVKTENLGVDLTLSVSASFGIQNGDIVFYGFTISIGIGLPIATEPGVSIAGFIGYSAVL